MAWTPPHDLNAEEAVLGSMMLSGPAAVEASERLTPADFYKPAHARIFEACLRLLTTGHALDPVTIFAALGAQGLIERPELFQIQAGTPASVNVSSYIDIVATLAWRRRTIEYGGQLIEVAQHGGSEAIASLLGQASDLRPAVETAEEGLALEDLEATMTDYDWLVPGLIEKMDRVLFTGAEGFGKSTMLRQLSICAALGVHPFTLEQVKPRRTLVVDFENTRAQNAREYGKMRNMTARWPERWERGRWRIICETGGIDLASARGKSWLDRQLDHHQPEVLILGPMYKAYSGGPNRAKDSEETAELVVEGLDRLRLRYGCAMVMEGHSPHGERGDRAGGRMRGSSLWQAWPEFVFYLEKNDDLTRPAANLRRARGERDRERGWPKILFQGRATEFPWTTEDTPEAPPTPGDPSLEPF